MDGDDPSIAAMSIIEKEDMADPGAKIWVKSTESC